ncbi:MAG: D-arabinono-1,4-lactone oxidase [Alphaproteobacteria bacterium]
MTGGANGSGWGRARPSSMLSPASEGELAAFVRDARAPVRVVGSGHSFTPLCETDGTLLSLDRMQGVVGVDLAASRATVRAGSKIHSLGRPLHDAGVGLKNQGDIDRQAIAGAVGTGTHGTGPTLGSLSSEVQAFRLVTAQGEVLACSPNENAEIWEGGRTSLGVLGVFSEITLGVAPAYRLKERNWVMPAADCWRQLGQLKDAHRHFEFFWFPMADEVVAKTLDVTDEPVRAPVGSDRMQARGEEGSWDQRVFETGCQVARLLPGLSGPLQRFFTRGAMGAGERARWSHEIFPSARTVLFNEMEYAVPAANGADCIREVAEVIRTRNIAGVFPIEFRFVKADDIWLSPFYKRDAATISVHQYTGQDYKPLFDAVEPVFWKYGGRPHWGKLHSLRAGQLSQLYPMWDRFQGLRRRLDPDAKFLNTYLRDVMGG